MGTLVWVLSYFFPVLGPLVMFFALPGRPFVRRHAAMALAAWVTFLVFGAISALLTLVLIGFLLLPVLGVWSLAVVIIGAVRAYSGEEYNPAVIYPVYRMLFRATI